MNAKIIVGDALAVLRTLESESVQCVVTSPPYWGLRDYGCAGQLGLESTPAEYIAKMVEVFREVKRVLRSDGYTPRLSGQASTITARISRRECNNFAAKMGRTKRATNLGSTTPITALSDGNQPANARLRLPPVLS